MSLIKLTDADKLLRTPAVQRDLDNKTDDDT